MNTSSMISKAKLFGGFMAVSGINTLFGYTAYAVFLQIGLTPLIAVMCSTLAGVTFNFSTLGKLFGSHAREPLIRYILAYVSILGCNLLLLNYLITAGIAALFAQGIAVLLLAPVSFTIMRRFVFEGQS